MFLANYLGAFLKCMNYFINLNTINVKQNNDKCFTDGEAHGKIKLQKRSDDYGTGND